MSSPTYYKARRARLLERSRKGVHARERKRMENPPEREPKFERWYPLELGVRDKRSGDVAWVDLRSARDAAKRIRMVIKHYNT